MSQDQAETQTHNLRHAYVRTEVKIRGKDCSIVFYGKQTRKILKVITFNY